MWKDSKQGPTVSRLMWVVKGPEKNQELHRNSSRDRVSWRVRWALSNKGVWPKVVLLKKDLEGWPWSPPSGLFQVCDRPCFVRAPLAGMPSALQPSPLLGCPLRYSSISFLPPLPLEFPLSYFSGIVKLPGVSALWPISFWIDLSRLRGLHGLGQLCQHHGWLNRPLWVGLGTIPLFLSFFLWGNSFRSKHPIDWWPLRTQRSYLGSTVGWGHQELSEPSWEQQTKLGQARVGSQEQAGIRQRTAGQGRQGSDSEFTAERCQSQVEI